MRSPRAVVLLLAAILGAGNLAFTLARSTIPLRIDGVVSDVRTLREKHPGVDDVHILVVSGRSLQVDAEVAEHLHPGDRVSKARWASRMQRGRGSFPLRLSRDFRGMLVAVPVTLAWAGVLRRNRVGRNRR